MHFCEQPPAIIQMRTAKNRLLVWVQTHSDGVSGETESDSLKKRLFPNVTAIRRKYCIFVRVCVC